MNTSPKFSSLFRLLCISVLLNGCTLVYKGTGEVMIGYAEQQGLPYMLATDDVAFACSMSEAFTPFLISFSSVTSAPDQIAVVFYLMAGNCTEFKAWEQELRYLRAVYAHNATEAQDARIAQQRLLALAARRQLKGYHFLSQAFTEPGEQCPELSSDNEELYWLIGLVDGLQAIMNDLASGGQIGVPMNIAAKVGRAASCLNDEKWWGMPAAIQAAIGITMPGNQSADKDPIQVLQHSINMGRQQGVILPLVLATQIYMGQGKIAEVKQSIRDYVRLKTELSQNETFRILNEVAKLQIQVTSDRLWTKATGKRTPIGKMGTFWDDPKKIEDTIDIDELL